MPDFMKKAAKRTDEVCAEHEEAVAALFCRPRQGDETKRLGTPGGALSRVSKLADAGEEEAADPRDAMFGQNAVLVLTTNRLLAFGHGTYTGRVKDLLGAIDLVDVGAIDLEAPPVGESGASSLAIECTDGYRVMLTPGSRRRRFIEAFETLNQPA